MGFGPEGCESQATTALEAHWSLALLAALATSAFVPLVEEITFRRTHIDWLLTKMQMALAAVIVIITFTLVYVSPGTKVYVVFLSTSLAFTHPWFKLLWASMLIHATSNGIPTAAAIATLLH
ncbi:type II CAAX prenyl endopeptidase Rce1 family protein [Brevibacterium ravenspurgense]|uniref:CPBP family glutamic-type intramembrane protease n=1 Tax=Brevibacterium ravenspurgense TaxID=479117 RepID=UPI0007846529|nr:CPBP family glutamic-type intramembrane protease [Brevibacterium ravenspurgense]